MKVDRRKRKLVVAPQVVGDQKISELPLREVVIDTDEVPLIAGGVNYRAPVASLVGLIPPGSNVGLTVDTGALYRTIFLSDGLVRAIPVAAPTPITPTGLEATIRLTSVTLEWNAAAAAHHYNIYRNGVFKGARTLLTFRDTTTVVGQTYSYQVQTADQYGQRSPLSDAVSAYMDPALNQAPNSVEVMCWPNPLPTDGPAFVRVNASDIDVQNIAYVLDVDVGSLTSTDDPSVWIIRI